MFNTRKVRKVVILGDPMVGKTSLRKRFLGEGFSFNYMVTIGADFGIYHHSSTETFQIWDLAGQANFEVVRESYYKGTYGALLVFDISRPVTFENLPRWIEELKRNLDGELVPFVLVGNKADLRENSGKWAVKEEEGQNYANLLSDWSSFDVPYYETSALTGLNVEVIFNQLIEEIVALESTK